MKTTIRSLWKCPVDQLFAALMRRQRRRVRMWGLSVPVHGDLDGVDVATQGQPLPGDV